MKTIILQSTLEKMQPQEVNNLLAAGFIPKRTKDGVNYLVKDDYGT